MIIAFQARGWFLFVCYKRNGEFYLFSFIPMSFITIDKRTNLTNEKNLANTLVACSLGVVVHTSVAHKTVH